MTPLTPDEIQAKSFTSAMRGYDKEEVDEFLRELSVVYAEALRTSRLVASPADPVESLGSEVTEVLRTARDAAQALTERSKAEADQIRKRAADKALEIRRQAQEESEKKIFTATAEAKKTLQEAQEHAARAVRTAEEQAAKLRKETAQEVTWIRDEARREASHLLDDATAKHKLLVQHEENLRDKVASAQEALGILKGALDDADDAAALAAEPVELAGTGKSDQRVWSEKEIIGGEPKPVPAAPPK